MKKLLFVALLLSAKISFGQGFATAAVPTKVDNLPGYGFVISGAFGNAGGCTIGGLLYVKSDHPQYKQLYGAAITALVAGKKLSAYVHSCESILWFSVPSTTYNLVGSAGSLAIGE